MYRADKRQVIYISVFEVNIYVIIGYTFAASFESYSSSDGETMPHKVNFRSIDLHQQWGT